MLEEEADIVNQIIFARDLFSLFLQEKKNICIKSSQKSFFTTKLMHLLQRCVKISSRKIVHSNEMQKYNIHEK